MTLDEAIARLNDEHRHEFVLEPGQLEEWLTELKEAKQLLKAAVEDIHDILTSQRKITNYALCHKCSYYLDCTCKDICETRCDLKQWRHEAEVLKLIGEGGDTECQ